MDSFTVSDLIPASPLEIFQAWLDAAAHAAFTGASATSDPTIGGAFPAWDGYIQGTHLALDVGRRIRQAWRTTEFPEGAESSIVEIVLAPTAGGTLVTLNHDRIPAGQAASYLSGWKTYYFEPLKKHFGARATPARASAKKATRKTTPKKVVKKKIAATRKVKVPKRAKKATRKAAQKPSRKPKRRAKKSTRR